MRGQLTQAPQLTYCDTADPGSCSFHQQPRSGGFHAAYPSPGHGQPPRKDKDKKEKKEKPDKGKKDKKDSGGKAAKEKKDKKGKTRGLDSDSDSESEFQRKADAGKPLLAAAFGRF